MIAPPVYTDLSSLSNLRGATANGSMTSEEQLESAAEQFSAVFLQMALKSMRDASLGEGAMDSQQSEFYRDMFDKQLSLELSSAEGFGLTRLIVAQLSGNPVQQAQAYRSVEDLSRTPETQATVQDNPKDPGISADTHDVDHAITNEPESARLNSIRDERFFSNFE